ncbi:MAG: class I SAM-dependent methyltransferase [Firmicutes bacterium]|nr:class I SAM-dependent methyltransferase [Bacillota bacterium]
MGEKPSLFNRIAAVYGLFFKWQVRNYRSIFAHVKEELDFTTYQRAIDIGCGTGALCQALKEYGAEVTGIDFAEAMLAIAEKKIPGIRFMRGDVLKGLPFPDKSFDLAISSYVAHGFMPGERLLLYQEMSRVARRTAVLIDYNEHRSLITDVAEWLEGGDYFSFIGRVRDELMQQFGNLKVINTGKRSAMYICKIKD